MGNNDNVSIVKHELYTSFTNIPKFSGDVEEIDVDTFLARVDTHIANKGVNEETVKIEILKHYVDNEKGRARHVIRYDQLDKIKIYQDYKDSFRKYFKKRSDLDALRSLVKVFKTQRSEKEGRSAYLARLDVLRQELVNLMKSSDWRKDDESMKIEQVAKMITISKFIAETDNITAEKLYKDVQSSSHIGDIDILLEGYEEIPRTPDPYVLPVNPPQETTVESTGRSRTPTRTTHSRSRSTSRVRAPPIECYNCHKVGHTYKECHKRIICHNCQYPGHHANNCRNLPWCNYHKMTGHRTQNCRAKKNQDFCLGTDIKPEPS